MNDILFDSVFGDISFTKTNDLIDIDLHEDETSFLIHSIRGRLKSIDGDYGSAYKYNLFKTLGKRTSEELERLANLTIFNMLTFDNLISPSALIVKSVFQGNKLISAIRIINNKNKNVILDMTVVRHENGRIE